MAQVGRNSTKDSVGAATAAEPGPIVLVTAAQLSLEAMGVLREDVSRQLGDPGVRVVVVEQGVDLRIVR